MPFAVSVAGRPAQIGVMTGVAAPTNSVTLVDEMNDAVFYSLSNLIKEQPEFTPQALNALIIARNLERVGDHATNFIRRMQVLFPGSGLQNAARPGLPQVSPRRPL